MFICDNYFYGNRGKEKSIQTNIHFLSVCISNDEPQQPFFYIFDIGVYLLKERNSFLVSIAMILDN
jgi:hypothetical protein